MNSNKVTQVSIGRFHHFHLARQLQQHKLLHQIWSGYPKYKLYQETGIPLNKIMTFPWFQTPYMAACHTGLNWFPQLKKKWEWIANNTIDRHVASVLEVPGVIVALSANGLYCGQRMKMLGGVYICDRGSSHILFQDQILREEFERWGIHYYGIDPRIIDKEIEEYEAATVITVPSEFCIRSFTTKGISQKKMKKIPYGANLSRFRPVANPGDSEFQVLWVGAVSIRKGFLDVLNGFQQLKHPRKKFVVIGNILPEMNSFLKLQKLDDVKFIGQIPNIDLPAYYSTSHVFVLGSIEEGLATVLGESLACGCPVIATTNTGAEDLYTNDLEGYIVPIRSPELITSCLQELADNPEKRQAMSVAALQRVNLIGGWDSYGDQYATLIRELFG